MLANTNSQNIVRNELSFTTNEIRIYPKRDHRSSAIAFRFELHGCPNSKYTYNSMIEI